MEKVYLKPEDIVPLFGIGRTTAYGWLKENKFDIAYEKKSGKRRIVFSQDVYDEIKKNSEIDPELNMKFLKESEQFIENTEQSTGRSEVIHEGFVINSERSEQIPFTPNNVQTPSSNNIDANSLVQDLVHTIERLSKEAGQAKDIPLLTDNLSKEQKENKELHYKYADLLKQFNDVQIELNSVRSELNTEKAKNQTLIEENTKKQSWFGKLKNLKAKA